MIQFWFLFLFFFLFIPHDSLATTKLKEGGQRSSDICIVHGKLQSVTAERTETTLGNQLAKDDSIWWNIEVTESKAMGICPNLGLVKFRIRGADFLGEKLKPQIIYPLQINEPEKNRLISAEVQLISGFNTLVKQNYSEWTLHSWNNE